MAKLNHQLLAIRRKLRKRIGSQEEREGPTKEELQWIKKQRQLIKEPNLKIILPLRQLGGKQIQRFISDPEYRNKLWRSGKVSELV